MRNSSVERISNEKSSSCFDIHSLQYINKNSDSKYNSAHKQNRFEIIWVQTGDGFHVVNMSQYPITNNMVFCAMPGQLHQLKINHDAQGYIISFTEPFLYHEDENSYEINNKGFFPLISQCPGIKLEREIAGELLEIIIKMMREYNNQFLFSAEMLRRYLKIFLIHIRRHFDTMQPNALQAKNAVLLNKFISLLEKHYKEKKLVTDYAEQLFLTPSYLNEVVKRMTGYPASHHIQQRIVTEAKRKAVYSDFSMKEIAYDLGFDPSHFSKFFKNVSGSSFTDFKKLGVMSYV